MATTYTVESGDHNSECGHHHKSIEAAHKCGEKLYDSRIVNGLWTANARWHAYRVIDNTTGKSVPHGEW
jgi:hypothetical protein